MKWKGDKKHSPPSVPDMVYWSIEKSDRTWISVYKIKTKYKQRKDNTVFSLILGKPVKQSFYKLNFQEFQAILSSNKRYYRLLPEKESTAIWNIHPPPHPNMVSVETSMFNAEYLKQNKKGINWKTLII